MITSGLRNFCIFLLLEIKVQLKSLILTNNREKNIYHDYMEGNEILLLWQQFYIVLLSFFL